MKCARCGHENRPGAKFCEECAAPLARVCANCGAPLSVTAKFCSECAHPAGRGPQAALQRFGSPELYTPHHLAEKILTSKASLEGERKQVTVLFADLKGSMELLADSDPLCAGMVYLAAGRMDEAASVAREVRALARRLRGRGNEAYALCLAGDAGSTDRVEEAEASYRDALGLASELGMRPLVAHGHRGLGKLHRRTGKHDRAHEHLATATTMYREMDMRFWREQAETAMSDSR